MMISGTAWYPDAQFVAELYQRCNACHLIVFAPVEDGSQVTAFRGDAALGANGVSCLAWVEAESEFGEVAQAIVIGGGVFVALRAVLPKRAKCQAGLLVTPALSASVMT